MKLERINENQFKCILDEYDILKNNLFSEELIKNPLQIKEFFEEVLYTAKKVLGFEYEADTQGITIENTVSSDNQISLLITKIDKKPSNNRPFINAIFSNSSNSGESKLSVDFQGFEFKCFDTVKELSKSVPNIKNCKSSLYTNSDMSSFYLLLKCKEADPNKLRSFTFYLEEFGVKMMGNVSENFCEEHFLPLIRNNALTKLKNL